MQITARTIDSLPSELLLSIISELNPQSLLNAALVSKRFHGYATSQLYRNVFFVEMGIRDNEGGPDNHLGCGLPDSLDSYLPLIPRGTRIFDIDGFCLAVSDSVQLRRSVLAASFCWDSGPGSIRDYQLKDLYSLLAPSIRFFHLSPPPGVGRTFVEYPVTSLQIDEEQIQSSSVRGFVSDDDLVHANELRRARMYQVFATPTLKRLSLEDVDDWGSWDLPIKLDWRQTSSVIHLRIFQSNYPRHDLIELLGWPRGLRTFSFELKPEMLYFGQANSFPVLAEALWQQRSTLEFIEFGYGVQFSLNDAFAAGRGFDEYSCLRDLSLQSRALTKSRRHGEESAMHGALDCFPLGLERLQIQLNEGIWEKATRYSELLPPWLQQLAVRKAKHTPQLRLVILWAPAASNASSDPDLCEEWRKTLEVMHKAGVVLRWSDEKDRSPMTDPRLPDLNADSTKKSDKWRIWDSYGIPRYPSSVIWT